MHSSRSLRLLLAVLLCICLWPGPLWAQEPTTGSEPSASPSAPQTLSDNLQALVTLSQELVTRLTERQKQVADLQASLQQARQSATASAESLAALEAQLTQAEESLSSLRAELAVTSSSLAASQTSLAGVSASFKDYRTEAQAQIAQVTMQRNLAIVGGVVVALALIVALVLK